MVGSRAHPLEKRQQQAISSLERLAIEEGGTGAGTSHPLRYLEEPPSGGQAKGEIETTEFG